MFAILNITFPIFALIGLGYVLTRRRVFQPVEMDTLGRFTVNVALPALVLNAMVSQPLENIVNPGYLVTYAIATAATIGLVWAILRLAGFNVRRQGVGMLGVCSSNSGYIGYPIMMLAYPNLAATVLTLQVIVENFVSIPLGLFAAEATTVRVRTHPLRLIGRIFVNVIKRPMIMMVVVGLVINISGIPMPQGLGHMVEILATATSAVALFYIGGSLVNLPHQSGDGLFVSIVVGTKLVAMPLLMLGMVYALPYLGLPVTPQELVIPMVLSAAMPMMGIFPILAREYGESGIGSVTLLVATIASFFSISILLIVLHIA